MMLIDGAAPRTPTRVRQIPPHGSLEETLAPLASELSVVLPRTSIPTNHTFRVSPVHLGLLTVRALHVIVVIRRVRGVHSGRLVRGLGQAPAVARVAPPLMEVEEVLARASDVPLGRWAERHGGARARITSRNDVTLYGTQNSRMK